MDKGAILDIIFGRWRSQITYAGVKLGIFDALGRDGEDAAAFAEELGLDPALSYRLLRALACLGLLQEHAGRRFSLTSGGAFLRADHPETLRGITLLEEGPEHYAIWKHLPDLVRAGRQNAFVREFGHMAFDHPAENPEYARAFDEAMSSYSSTETAGVLDALAGRDLSRIAHVCDVGGGRGHLLCSLLARHPHMRGTLLERGEVLEDESQLWARKMNVADRCAHVAGDMFAEVPSADAYVLKHIIHDWNDEECVRILSNLRDAAPPNARIFIAEYVVSGPETTDFAKLFDIHMMCWGTGRERTSEEYAALLDRAGWRYIDTAFPSIGAIGIVEGTRA
ncbi:MAG: methyltransferase [Candidatus Binatia bacterium]